MNRSYVLVTALLVGMATLVTGGGHEPSAAQDDLTPGGAVFQRYCAACHGSDGNGLPGTGVTAGPPIDDVDVAFVDLVLRTGRMPIRHRPAGIIEERLTDEQRESVVVWMQQRFDLPGRIPEVGTGDPGRGQEAFVANCAACHGTAATGGVTGDGAIAPSLHGLDPVALTEAARVGPFAMPRISEAVLDDEAVADIAAYVQHASSTSTTPLGLSEPGHVLLGVFAFFVLVGGFAAIWATIRTVEGRAEEET